ncbi:MAG: hypothetical protein WBN22_01440 [Verrucomicrobiia bacterium]
MAILDSQMRAEMMFVQFGAALKKLSKKLLHMLRGLVIFTCLLRSGGSDWQKKPVDMRRGFDKVRALKARI